MSIDNQFGQPPRLLPRTIEDVLRSWMLRGGGVVLVTAAAIIWIAMLTWSANDPSVSVNTSEPVQNLLGPFGAIIADFFFHTLGLSVVFFVVPPVVLGMQLALGDTVTDQRRRLAMMAIATVAIAAGCSALPLVAYWPLELGYGGIIGDFAYSVVASIVSEAAPGAGGTIAGLIYFALGFWAFSRAICLDRYDILAVRLPQRGAHDRARTEVIQTGLRRLWQRTATVQPAQNHAATAWQPAARDVHHEPEPPNWSMR